MRTLLTMWAVEGMWAIDRPADWVGRDHELAVLRAGVEAVRRGEGAAVWVEGEPGIGKSTLVAEALAETSGLGWDVGWGIADRLTERLPLRVMLDCLQVRADSADPRRAQAAGLIRSRHPGPFTDGDASSVGVEVLVTLAAELCGAVPMVMVIDDVQWADEASLVVWHQLAASIGQLPLLLIATCRLSPRRPSVWPQTGCRLCWRSCCMTGSARSRAGRSRCCAPPRCSARRSPSRTWLCCCAGRPRNWRPACRRR